MASSSDFFVGLPSEILLTIFESQGSFRDIRSLFSTCKGIYGLWQTRVSSISNDLLIKQSPCYDEVRVLVMANETTCSAATRPHLNLLNLNQRLNEKYQTTLDRLVLYRQLTGQAKYLCNIIQTRYLSSKYHCHDAACRAHPPTLIPQERVEIIRAHHFIKLYALTYSNADLAELHKRCEDKLRDMCSADKHLLHQVSRIMHDYALPWDKLRLGIHSPFSPAGLVDFNACCCRGWSEKFQAIKQATKVTVVTCGECIWDDIGVFGRMSQDERERDENNGAHGEVDETVQLSA